MTFRIHVVWAHAAFLALGTLSACLLADPPRDAPVPEPHRPTIVHASASPPPTTTLASFPTQFIVPVEMLDATASFDYNVFIDYPAPGSLVWAGRVAPDPSATRDNIRLVPFSIPPPDARFCHVVEFIVALTFNGASSHTPDSRGGDTIVWFYNPGGDRDGCPEYDAGSLDGAFPLDAAEVPDAGD